MTQKENALRIIRFDHPEWVEGYVPCWNIGYHGVNHQSYEESGDDGHWRPVGVKWTDIWGTVWEKDQPDVMGFPRGNPLAETESLRDYVWPDPNDPRIYEKIYKGAEAYRTSGRENDLFLCGAHRDTLWEKSYMLVGMENMMCYFYEEPDYAKEILHRIMDFQLGIAEHYIKVGVEMVALGDDLGTQRSLLFSPEILQEFFVPEYRRLFDFYKQRGVLINFHSCGHIEPALDVFMDLGVDVLNPIQANANSLENILAKTKGRMALCGAIPTPILLDGTVDEIRENVKNTIALLGRDGGYFCTPDQWMSFPEENIHAMWQALRDYGIYGSDAALSIF